MDKPSPKRKARSCALRRKTETARTRSLPKATLDARDEAFRLAYDDSVPGAKTRLEILQMLHS